VALVLEKLVRGRLIMSKTRTGGLLRYTPARRSLVTLPLRRAVPLTMLFVAFASLDRPLPRTDPPRSELREERATAQWLQGKWTGFDPLVAGAESPECGGGAQGRTRSSLCEVLSHGSTLH